MDSSQPSANVANLTPAKMAAAIKGLPPLTVAEYVDQHFKGQVIRASGKIRRLDDLGGPYVTASFEDDTGVRVSANFTKPVAPEVKLLSSGEKIEVVGTVFNVGAEVVVLDDCRLSKANDQSIMQAIVSSERKWWETWWGKSVLGIVITVVGGLIVWSISRHIENATSQDNRRILGSPTSGAVPHVGQPAGTEPQALAEIAKDPAYSPVTLVQFFATYYNRDLTKLQQEEFGRGLIGRRIVWEGLIKSVEGEQDGSITVIIQPPGDRLSNAFLRFDTEDRQDLLNLKVGQRIQVTGILRNVIASPFVRECKILRVFN